MTSSSSSPSSSDSEVLAHPACDFRNPRSFVTYWGCPTHNDKAYLCPSPHGIGWTPRRHWCFLGEIMDIKSTSQTTLRLMDKLHEYCILTLHFSDDTLPTFDFSRLHVGYTVAILYAVRYDDGFRVFNPGNIQIFPCSIRMLLDINDAIDYETPENHIPKCQECGNPDGVNKIVLRRCARCQSVSYCSKECQAAAWNKVHHKQCKISRQVADFKRGRNWNMSHFKRTLEATDREHFDYENDIEFIFRPEWSLAQSAVVEDLLSDFIVDSGELLWGHLPCIVLGMNSDSHDQPPRYDNSYTSGRILKHSWNYRAPARCGIWKISRVNGMGNARYGIDSWIAYHSAVSPIDAITLAREVGFENRIGHRYVSYVNKNDWGFHFFGQGSTARTLEAVDNDSGWKAVIERERRLSKFCKTMRKGHPDYDRWRSLDQYRDGGIFLLDGSHGADLLKTIARPSELDIRTNKKEPCSLISRGINGNAFGCRLTPLDADAVSETARLVFSGPQNASGEKELMAFWYTSDIPYEEKEGEWGTPTISSVLSLSQSPCR